MSAAAMVCRGDRNPDAGARDMVTVLVLSLPMVTPDWLSRFCASGVGGREKVKSWPMTAAVGR